MAPEPAQPAPNPPALPPPETPVPRTLTCAELGMVEHWVQLADALGFPKSLAQIYGLIFTSKDPVSAQECVDVLRISRSSAGQGLKALRDLGAIRAGFELGARREAFIIEPDIGVMIQSMLNGRLVPAFDTFSAQIDSIQQSLDPEKDLFLISRIEKLHRWRSKLGRLKKWLLQ